MILDVRLPQDHVKRGMSSLSVYLPLSGTLTSPQTHASTTCKTESMPNLTSEVKPYKIYSRTWQITHHRKSSKMVPLTENCKIAREMVHIPTFNMICSAYTNCMPLKSPEHTQNEPTYFYPDIQQ